MERSSSEKRVTSELRCGDCHKLLGKLKNNEVINNNPKEIAKRSGSNVEIKCSRCSKYNKFVI